MDDGIKNNDGEQPVGPAQQPENMDLYQLPEKR
jgi:hypothetical protein